MCSLPAHGAARPPRAKLLGAEHHLGLRGAAGAMDQLRRYAQLLERGAAQDSAVPGANPRNGGTARCRI